MARTPEQHSADSRQAAHTMWSAVADRNERLRTWMSRLPIGTDKMPGSSLVC
jgi:hypothetical protein